MPAEGRLPWPEWANASLSARACQSVYNRQIGGQGAQTDDNEVLPLRSLTTVSRADTRRAATTRSAALVEFQRVTKQFGGTLAVDRVQLRLESGTILALLGENGAGKSTLIKMLAGVHAPDAGQILIDGQPVDHASRSRIAFIHQDLGLIDSMTVAENIALVCGYAQTRGLISWRQTAEAAREALEAIGGEIDPDALVSGLSRTEKSLLAIARALARRADVLVLDEPTASLPAFAADPRLSEGLPLGNDARSSTSARGAEKPAIAPPLLAEAVLARSTTRAPGDAVASLVHARSQDGYDQDVQMADFARRIDALFAAV